ncbi:MAG: DUF5063 domain-containing protein [Candidatus Thiodiazotropha sp. (ex Lucinoma aequizonata)]|nr:DUF5063 domain-containing protein [Candidatus Thiodiazotropha sp. (ex Lucinoma aequizonata)]MCU7888995.1 DUF5063 domain-containing protein [Candidatus Thiodiazotropha sp. (ex Lucinoma aequizonata)]MCU7894321.1 DUF5063 domain-containing protein [Candidatus Thiodiazotropha sp. (ex Lucinoma aequizonata)]MCU7900261.1 DUF5063 domain-containing protein [Candidatus Thiodiazotropha sp. (ex Lucinoma aequizonata)]MCU7904088.1 DUF5063 domain-containing protein [Candidatus Thiodiazotropha sp. (ex Lucino
MSPKIEELEVLARNYCELVESLQEGNTQWLQEIAGLLPRLHAAVSALNLPTPRNTHYTAADLDARFELYTYLRQLLGERDGYWMEFDMAGEGQSMSGSLADDLTDIYCELKNGLKMLDDQPEQAVEDWHKGFHVHWGQHLLDAERHLYDLNARNQLAI